MRALAGLIILFLPVLVFMLFLVLLIMALKRRTGTSFPYERQPRFLSPAERSFYGVLCQVVTDDQVVIVKVRLADLIKVESGGRRRDFWRYFNKIQGKHVDFVVCDRATMEPVYCVELDDRSHQANRRQERDTFVDRALEAAEVRLVRVPCKKGYSLDEVKQMLGMTLGVGYVGPS